MGVGGRKNPHESCLSQRCLPLPPPQAMRRDPPQLREENIHKMQGDDESLRAACIEHGVDRNWCGQYGTWPLAFKDGPFGTNYPPSFDSDDSSGTVYQADRAHPDTSKDPPVLRDESTGLTEANLATHTNNAPKTYWISSWVGAPRYIQDSVVNKALTSTKGGPSSSMGHATEAADDAFATVLAGVGVWSTAATDAVALPTLLDLGEANSEADWVLVEPQDYDDEVNYIDIDMTF